MTNEMDLHAADRGNSFGLSRLLVYYYLVLVLSAPVIFFVLPNSAWKFAFSVVLFIAFITPLVYAVCTRRSLRSLREAQVEDLRKSTD